MLAVCRAGSNVTEVLAQYAGLSQRPSMTKTGVITSLHHFFARLGSRRGGGRDKRNSRDSVAAEIARVLLEHDFVKSPDYEITTRISEGFGYNPKTIEENG